MEEQGLTTHDVEGDGPPGHERPALTFFSDFVELVYGILFNPAATLRSVARRALPPIGVGLSAYLVTAFIGGLATGGSMVQAMRQVGSDLAPVFGVTPPGLPGGAAMTSGSYALIIAFLAVFIGPALLFVKAGVLGLTSSLFGGRGDGRRLLAALGLTYTPALVAVPVNLLLAGRPGVGVLAGLLTLAILVWRLVLDIIAIREVHALSTGRAAAAALVPLGVGVALVTIVFLMSMGLILSILGPIFQSGLPGVG